MTSKNITRALISGFLAILFTLPANAANLAGTTVFVSGKVTATDLEGNVRALKAKDQIFSGDTLETRKGRVQIKFLDGAFMSVQPNSRFQIEEYNYANKSDGSEKAVYNLFKGGMRAFTGAIGKKHPDAYKVKTPVATIGVRGTGHNTRICSGDCTGTDGKPLPDGLYHSTWEGTTFVTNDSGTSTVPFGSAVYVQAPDTPAEETTDTSQATASQPSQDTVQELVEENQEQVVLEAGDQVNSEGMPDDIPDTPPNPNPITPLTNLNAVAVAPDPTSPDGVDITLSFETTTFVGTAGPIGAIGTDINDGPPGTVVMTTIDPDAILASTDPAAADARALITAAMANPDNDELFDEFFADPAGIAENTVESNIGFGRWADGKVLLFDDDGNVFLKTLTGDDSLHYIFGNAPAVAEEGVMGTYDFVGGTQSTGSIGDGVTSGQLTFDFSAGTGTIAMTVSHGLIYTLEGDLLIDVVFPALFGDDGTLVATTTTGNCSEGGCTAFVEGSFFGPLFEGGPAGAGLEYDIQDGAEVIKGVAAFENVTEPPPPELVQVSGRTLLGITPEMTPEAGDTENSGEGQFLDTTVLNAVDNRAGMPGIVASIGTETDDGGPNSVFEVLLTIDPNGVLDVSAPDSAVTLAQNFITTALADGGANAAAVNAVIDTPAALVEYREGTFSGSDYALGRWSGGNVLFIDEVTVGDNVGDRFVEFDTLAANQSLHFLHGQPASASFGTGATGTYNLVDATAASLTTGGPNGSVQSGSLTFDFVTLNGTIDMDVLFDAELFMVNGALEIDPGTTEFFDTGGVTALTAGGSCEFGCNTIIDGVFFGPQAGTGVDGAPVLAALDYDIVLDPFDTETPAVGESIIGNALFGRSGTADPIPEPGVLTMVQNQALLGIETNLFRDFNDPDNADGGSVTAVTVLTGLDSAGTNGMAAAIGKEFNEDDSGMGVDENLDLLITIDPNGVLAVGSPDANVTRGQQFINDALAGGGVDAAKVNSVIADPATVAEHTNGTFLTTDFEFGRWTDGKILFIDEVLDGPNTGMRTVDFDDLDPNSHLHYLFGDTATNPLTGATGTYALLPQKGTISTGTHDGSLGSGVQSGTLLFDFTSLNGDLVDLVILHDTTYTVNGDLKIDFNNPTQFYEVDDRVSAVTAAGPCAAGCETFIEGTFFGNLVGAGADAAPEVAGLEYEIISEPFDGEIGNSIIGNAVFGRSGTAAPIDYAVASNQNLVGVLPNPTQPPPIPDEFADVALITGVTAITGDDSVGTPGLALFAGTEVDDEGMLPEILFVVATVNTFDILSLDIDPGTDEFRALTLLNDARGDEVFSPIVASVEADPAKVAEFFQGDGFAFGRWADGKVLFLDENEGSGLRSAEADTLVNNQSLHFIYGETPATPGMSATGTYTFTGGTQSTTVSGATIGNGITGGQLTFDFTSLSGTVAMTVNHLTDYNIAGALAIDAVNPGQFFDQGAVATTVGGNCDLGCSTFIDGGFAGQLAGGAQASPEFAGLEYDIFDPVDGIMGVGAFSRTGNGPVPE